MPSPDSDSDGRWVAICLAAGLLIAAGCLLVYLYGHWYARWW
jgi:hypothetical protein